MALLVTCSPRSGPLRVRESCRIYLQEDGLENQEVFGDADNTYIRGSRFREAGDRGSASTRSVISDDTSMEEQIWGIGGI